MVCPSRVGGKLSLDANFVESFVDPFLFIGEASFSGRLRLPWGIRPDSFNIPRHLEGQIMAYSLAFNIAAKRGIVVYVVNDTYVTTTRPTSGKFVEVHP